MSYARFGADGSDVYVFADVGGYLSCCGCILQDREWVEDPESFLGGYLKAVGEIVQTRFDSTDAMLAHLDMHRAAGHTILQDTIDGLNEDRAENDAWLASPEAIRERSNA